MGSELLYILSVGERLPVGVPSLASGPLFSCPWMFSQRSCLQRDRCGPHLMGDLTWLTERPILPLSVGQYVNNFTQGTVRCHLTVNGAHINVQIIVHMYSVYAV